MGFAIGAKLAGVGGNHQVICITHLPQVAVYGTAHFAVTKRVRGERTYTEIEPLAEEARTDELARMLGGRSPTQLTRAHAREMLATAKAGRRRE
jgi:DNA repair protein RecN (Recombination protein N)